MIKSTNERLVRKGIAVSAAISLALAAVSGFDRGFTLVAFGSWLLGASLCVAVSGWIGGPFVDVYFNMAGMVCVYVFGAYIHLGVQRPHRQWGYASDWYDGPIHSFGFGPIALFVW